MKKRALSLGIAALAALGLSAEIEFRGLDLGGDAGLLFTARAGIPGGESYDSLFSAEPASGKIRPETFYPEEISLVDGGRRLQVRNRFGLFRSGASLTDLAAVPGFPCFERGSPVIAGRLPPSSASPDGSFILLSEPSSVAYARLVLFDATSGARMAAAEGVEYSFNAIPARWSPDSRYFIYSKAGSLYYFSIEQLRSGRVVDESSRRIGEGRIKSVRWGQDGSLYYLKASSLYRILPAEFFTQALYRGLAGMGNLIGKTPFPYDPNFDDFWVSTDAQRIILSKGGRSLFLVYLDPDDFGSRARVTALPHLFLQGGTRVQSVLWPAKGAVTVFTGSIKGSRIGSAAYRFEAPADPSELDLAPKVVELDAAGVMEIQLSSDGSKVALVTGKGVIVRDYDTWAPRTEISAPGALHVLWRDPTRLVVAGRSLIESYDIVTGARNLLAISQAEAYGWAHEGSLMVKAAGQSYKKPAPDFSKAGASQVWQAQSFFVVKEAASSSPSFRVYLDSLASGNYKNAVMLRSAVDLGTKPLFPIPGPSFAPFPEKDEPRNALVFDHGSRIRRREVSLVFNALDSAEGLVEALAVLESYNITATFFVNGEFIRREPGAARLLSLTGHEVGSMFFTAVDPTDARFRSDRDYIRRGLARAEDEWFQATGKELSLLWHTPFYSANSDILEAGESMNYRYVGRDIDPLDWVGKTDGTRFPGSYKAVHAIIETVMAQTKPGSIIPIRLGIPDGGRDDYLFNELGLLVDALQGAGYGIVPISILIEHAE